MLLSARSLWVIVCSLCLCACVGGGGGGGAGGQGNDAGPSDAATSDAGGGIEGLSQPCSPFPVQNMPCPAHLTCGAPGGEQSGQCVIEGCPSAGPGPDHGCPVGAYCNVFDGDDGHYCTRVCTVDDDCGNPTLRCVSGSTPMLFGVKVCVR